MSGVFCKNCKFFKKYEKSRMEGCYFKTFRLNKTTGLKKSCYPIDVLFAEDRSKELNKNNNCKYYKRKWLKFWIKDK